LRFRFTLYNPTKGTQVLVSEPKGWDDIDILLKRDTKYHGVFREVTIKLGFWGEGKDYIDDVFTVLGPEEVITLTIATDPNNSNSYEEFYVGVLDLDSWETSGPTGQTDSFTEVNIIEQGIWQTVKNRLSTKVNLSQLTTLNGTAVPSLAKAPYDLTLHSKAIRYSTLFENDTNIGVMQEYQPTYGQNATIVDIYFNAPYQIRYSEFGEYQEPTAPYHPNGDFIFEADTTDNLIIDYDVAVDFIEGCDSLSRSFSIALALRVGATTYVLDGPNTFGPTTVNPINVSYSASGSQLVTGVNPGDQVYLYVNISNYTLGSGPPATSICRFKHTWSEGFIKISKDTTTAATTAKAFAIHETGAQIARVITDQQDAFRSEYFGRTNSEPNSYASNGCGAYTALTNGFQIRKFPIAERPVYMSMEDYFEGLNAIYNLGLGVEAGGSGYVIRVEPKEYFYSTEVLMQLPNIPELKTSNAKSYYYNDIEIGYTKWTNEELNGLDEFNTKRIYSNTLKNTSQKLTAMSTLVGSGYALEFARRQLYVDAPTTDYDYDNDNFIVCLSRSLDGSGNPILTTAEKDENFTDITDLISEATAYNLRISPARNLLRWLNVACAGILKYAAREIKFTYGEGNYIMGSEFDSDTCPGNYNNDTLTENQSIVWDSTSADVAPIWEPVFYDFKYPLSFSQYKAIKSNPTKCLEISRSETDFIKAFIIEVRYEPNKGLAEFKLLKAYDNN
jgi:hypothetical protein